MRLRGVQRFLFIVKSRYKIKREIFTLVIPCVIAIIFLIYVAHAGYIKESAIGTGFFTSSASNSTASEKAAELAALDANTTGAYVGTIVANPASAKQSWDIILVAVPLIAFTPYTIDVSRQERRARKYQEDFAALLFELSELVRGGIDPIKGFLSLAEGNTGSITNFVQVAAKQMQIGFSFEKAMKNLGNAINNDLVKKYIDLVIQASYSGGSVAGLIQRASSDMSTFIAIDKEKRSGLSQYTIILYTGQVVLIALCAILVIQFLPSLAAISSIGAAGLSGILGNADIANVTIERDLWYMVILNGFLGGLVIGKISEGKLKFGLKHSLALILIALIAWSAFVTPFAISTQQYHIQTISYDTQGTPGLPLPSPIILKITNLKGQPVNNTLVAFSISTGATVNPSTATTNGNGTVSTTVILGINAGIYNLVVTVGATQATFPILAESAASS